MGLATWTGSTASSNLALHTALLPTHTKEAPEEMSVSITHKSQLQSAYPFLVIFCGNYRTAGDED